MSLATELAISIDRSVKVLSGELGTLQSRIHACPELKFEEHNASRWIAELVESHGWAVARGIAGMKTALMARAGRPGGARVAVLAEYDALPDIGHACGHNLITSAAVGAFLAAASVVSAVGGEVVLLGTPAEEGGGGKIEMIKAGVFEGFDAAMMFHPFDRDLLAQGALATLWLDFEFVGRSSHAAIAPHAGCSALTACMDVFRLVDGQRIRFRDGVRVHGIVTSGGRAINVIPERAACEFQVRAQEEAELYRVRGIIGRCARGAALASDVELRETLRPGYKSMRDNLTLARRFGAHLEALGRSPRERDPRAGLASTDMGDVSHVVPAIHPWLAIVDEGEALCHERRFAEASATRRASDTALVAAKALARTAIELLGDAELRSMVSAEWSARAP
jgi:amidohydrolase